MPAHLKSLELHGYKTFANRTYFEFSEQITAIVGPNGSGKSNIADSLRWVLGEQSYHLLRGKKTEDMIFSGSEMRPRAGMASATVTFDNSDGWLPIDFSEVAITRRAYRDGENEYVINGQRMRLRDVSELLSNSGLAERTYTIIGQGLVDAALSLKAEERRRLFEEAAGIGLHRSRREEALHRLDITQRNLDRVRDILAELQPRLQSLERQARRAQEYHQIQSDLRILLHDWYGFHWHRGQQELAEARRVVRLQDTALDKARKEQKVLDEKLRVLRSRIQEIRQELNLWHHQLSGLHAQREQLNLELVVAEERQRSIMAQEERLQEDLVRLEEEAGLQKDRVLLYDQELVRLENELSDAENQLESSQSDLEKFQAKRAEVESELGSTHQSIQEKAYRKNQLQAQLRETETRWTHDLQTLESSIGEINALEREQQALEAYHQSQVGAQNTARMVYQAAERDYQDFVKELVILEAQLDSAKNELSATSTELAGLKAQLTVLDQAESALEGYSGGTRLLLRARQEKRLNGVRSILLNDLIVPTEYEVAISAVLGDLVQAVVMDDNVDEALNLMIEQSSRGAIIPSKAINPRRNGSLSIDGIKDEAIVLGIASELVQAPEELRSVVELLLGHVFVVQNRKAARSLLDNIRNSQPESLWSLRVVTLDGQVFEPGGVIQVSGVKSSEWDQSLIGRQRRQRTLKKEIETLHHLENSRSERILEVEQELQTKKIVGIQLQEELDTCQKKYQQATLAADQARLVAEQAQQQVVWRFNQREILNQEISSREALRTQLEKELAGVDEDLQRLNDIAHEQTVNLSRFVADEAQSRVNHWNTSMLLAQRLLNEARKRHQELSSTLHRILRQQQDTMERFKALETSQHALDSQKHTTQENFRQVGEKITNLQNLIEPAELELNKIEMEQDQVQAAEALARQTLNLAEHHSAQARIAQTRCQEALQSLRSRIEDDFGLVAFEYQEQVSGPNPLPLDGMVEKLPVVEQLAPEVEESLRRLQTQLRRIGPINPDAQAEFEEVSKRHAFLIEQIADLEKAEVDVRQVIKELDALMELEFDQTFTAVAEEFKTIFTRLFGGGSARLYLSDPDDLTNTGIEIEARLPGRRTQGLVLLSGGERSLTAAALVFALIKVSPTPFCLLDEVDAMLDEANVGRFRELLGELSQNTQFIIVTHNRNTVQAADVIYGVTMGRDSSSQVLSLKLDQVAEIVD